MLPEPSCSLDRERVDEASAFRRRDARPLSRLVRGVRRGDGHGAHAHRALAQHHRAPRSLVRGVRRRWATGRAGGAHPGASRSLPRAVEAALEVGPLARGDAIVLNDPFARRHAPAGRHAGLAGVPRRASAAPTSWSRTARTTPTSAAPHPARCRSRARSTKRACAFLRVFLERGGRVSDDVLRSCSPTCARPTSAAPTCSRSSARRRTGVQRLAELAARVGADDAHGRSPRADGARRALRAPTRCASFRVGRTASRTRSTTTASAASPFRSASRSRSRATASASTSRARARRCRVR